MRIENVIFIRFQKSHLIEKDDDMAGVQRYSPTYGKDTQAKWQQHSRLKNGIPFGDKKLYKLHAESFLHKVFCVFNSQGL